MNLLKFCNNFHVSICDRFPLTLIYYHTLLPFYYNDIYINNNNHNFKILVFYSKYILFVERHTIFIILFRTQNSINKLNILYLTRSYLSIIALAFILVICVRCLSCCQTKNLPPDQNT